MLDLHEYITVGRHKVVARIQEPGLTIGEVRKIMDHAIALMKQHQLGELVVTTEGYTARRDKLMLGYDCYKYGSRKTDYRLVNADYEKYTF